MSKFNFSECYSKDYSLFLKFANNLTHSREEAKDLVQDAAVKAYRNRSGLKDFQKFRPWFYRVIYNCYMTLYKKRSRRKELLELGGKNRSLFFNKRQELNKALSSLRYSEILKQLNNLNDKYKDAFSLHYAGYSYKEISNQFEIPIGTVKSRINSARNMLKQKLDRTAA